MNIAALKLTINLRVMKKVLLLVGLVSLLFIENSFAQDSASVKKLSLLLNGYYKIKDALVSGNSNEASARAVDFIKIVNSIDYKLISEGNINALLQDATPISTAEDIKEQRDHFANLSSNMIILAKAIRMTTQPVYQAYCPMKDANWLSSDKPIKNPYYGNAMPDCGKVVNTFYQ